MELDQPPQYRIRITQRRTNQIRYLDRHDLLVPKQFAQTYDYTTAWRIVNRLQCDDRYHNFDLELEEMTS
ncbi:hypothetical protein [Herpetosiphon sp. NSE202]|uniref:hypothetical protein n=1 Tax=Herpetosiphon sp. NSE202 TaxID=3351349 RepID=UPI00364109A8